MLEKDDGKKIRIFPRTRSLDPSWALQLIEGVVHTRFHSWLGASYYRSIKACTLEPNDDFLMSERRYMRISAVHVDDLHPRRRCLSHSRRGGWM